MRPHIGRTVIVRALRATHRNIEAWSRVKGGRLALPAFAAAAVLTMVPSVHADDWFVDDSATGSDNGQNWTNAWPTIQAAVISGSVQDGDRILVGQGVYKPSSQATSINLRTLVSIQGGYAGVGAGDPDDRDTVAYPTILSGDIDNDGPDSDNAYIVVSIPANLDPPTQSGTNFANRANLDGFIINGGYNPPVGLSPGRGAGIYAFTSSEAVIRKCIVHDNYAGQGAGTYVEADATLTFRQCEIHSNEATNKGGGVFVGGSASLLDCDIHTNNMTGTDQGDGGGGIRFESDGGTLSVVSSNIHANLSSNTGAGISTEIHTGAYLKLINSLIIDNEADSNGGGVDYFGRDSFLEITNCTFSLNDADGSGGALYFWAEATGSGFVKNSILWDDNAATGDEIQVGTGTLTVSYSDVKGGWSGAGSNNIGGNTTLDNPDFVGSGNFRLQCGSPCINVASDAATVSDSLYDANEDGEAEKIDMDLKMRIVETVDMGAYEKIEQATCYADVTENCVVDVDDLLLVINNWGPALPQDPEADVIPLCGNGVVDVDDLLVIINNWGPCPGMNCTGDSTMPQSIDDCWDDCNALHPGDEEGFIECFEDCVEALCKAEIIECED